MSQASHYKKVKRHTDSANPLGRSHTGTPPVTPVEALPASTGPPPRRPAQGHKEFNVGPLRFWRDMPGSRSPHKRGAAVVAAPHAILALDVGAYFSRSTMALPMASPMFW